MQLKHGVMVDTVVVGPVLGHPGAVGQVREARAGDSLAMVENGLYRLVEGLQPETFNKGGDAALPGAAGGDLGVQVADDAFRQTGVKAKQVLDFLVEHAGLVKLEAGHQQAFLEDVDRIEDVTGILLAEI